MPGKAWKTRKKRETRGKYLFVINFVKHATAKTVLFINITSRVYYAQF